MKLWLKELAKKSDRQFYSLVENTEKYKNFSISVIKQVKEINKKKGEITKTMSYQLQSQGYTYCRLHSARFVASSLPNLVDNLTEGIHKIESKCGHDKKGCKFCGIKYKDCECCLKCTSTKDDLTEYKWLCCNKSCPKKFDINLKRWFAINTNFLTMTSINFCCCWEKVFASLNIWLIRENSMNHH